MGAKSSSPKEPLSVEDDTLINPIDQNYHMARTLYQIKKSNPRRRGFLSQYFIAILFAPLIRHTMEQMMKVSWEKRRRWIEHLVKTEHGKGSWDKTQGSHFDGRPVRILNVSTDPAKSVMFMRYFTDCSMDTAAGTSACIGMDFKIKYLDVCGYTTKLIVFDSGESERFNSITNSNLQHSDAVVISFSVLSVFGSMQGLVEHYLAEIKRSGNPSIKIVLCALQVDLPMNRWLTTRQDYQNYAKKMGLHIVEVSAKTRLNLENLYLGITADVLNGRYTISQEFKGLCEGIYQSASNEFNMAFGTG